METTLIIFVVVTSVAVVIQAAILVGMFSQLRRLNERLLGVIDEIHTKVTPVISRVDDLIRETKPQIVGIVSDASDVVSLARSQAIKFDRVVTETLDRTRIQLIHMDQILTGALETVEETGSSIRRTIEGPVRQATAIIRGIKMGLEVLRSGRRPSGEPPSAADTSDEGLFI
jgi:phage-related protein